LQTSFTFQEAQAIREYQASRPFRFLPLGFGNGELLQRAGVDNAQLLFLNPKHLATMLEMRSIHLVCTLTPQKESLWTRLSFLFGLCIFCSDCEALKDGSTNRIRFEGYFDCCEIIWVPDEKFS
jgi:hypothetical protein